jgi:hypothetical protein
VYRFLLDATAEQFQGNDLIKSWCLMAFCRHRKGIFSYSPFYKLLLPTREQVLWSIATKLSCLSLVALGLE